MGKTEKIKEGVRVPGRGAGRGGRAPRGQGMGPVTTISQLRRVVKELVLIWAFRFRNGWDKLVYVLLDLGGN